jgi:hypothetical protein
VNGSNKRVGQKDKDTKAKDADKKDKKNGCKKQE